MELAAEDEPGGDSVVIPLNLATRHGRSTIGLGDVFTDPGACKQFLRELAFNNRKSVIQTYSSGNMVKWGCNSLETECSWHVWITEKRESKSKTRRKSKYSYVPSKAWYVSRISLTHSEFCMSIAKPSAQLLLDVRGFQSAFVEGHSSAFARVVNALEKIENVSMDGRKATLYRAIQLRLKQTQAPDDYSLLSGYLEAFQMQNPSSRVCCQVDENGRFCRLFLSIGPLVEQQAMMAPVLQTDGTHMKNENYDGVCLTMIGLDGDGKVVPLAVAFVPSETNECFSWFFANCIAAKINLVEFPLFTDRGKQRGAQTHLASLNLRVNLKFCTYHIVLNVKDLFKTVQSNIERVEPYIYRLQKSDTIAEYDASINVIDSAFSNKRSVRKANGAVEQQSVAQYLRKIHPTSWTRLGNYKSNEAEEQYLKTSWPVADSYGDSAPLHGVRTTSALEDNNNGLLWSGVRDNEVLMATVLFCKAASEIIAHKSEPANLWAEHKCNVTPTAKLLFESEMNKTANCSVRPASDSSSNKFTLMTRIAKNLRLMSAPFPKYSGHM